MNKEIDNTEKPKTQRKYFELLFCNDKYGSGYTFAFEHGRDVLSELNNIIMSEDITSWLRHTSWTLNEINNFVNIIIKPHENIDVELVNVDTVLDEKAKLMYRFYYFVATY